MRAGKGPGHWLYVIDEDTGEEVDTVWVPYTSSTPVVPSRSSPAPTSCHPHTPSGLVAMCNEHRDVSSFHASYQASTTCQESKASDRGHHNTPDRSVEDMPVSMTQKYECPCGSVVLDRRRHEQGTKKHRAWKRSNNQSLPRTMARKREKREKNDQGTQTTTSELSEHT